MQKNQISIERAPLIKWGWVRASLYLGGLTVAMILYRIVRKFLIDDYGFERLEYMFLQQALKCSTFVLVAYLLRKFIDRKSFISLGYSFASRFRNDFILGLGLGFGLISFMFGLLYISGSITITSIQFPINSLLLMFGILIFVSIREEIVSRGYILINLMDSMNKYVALLISSLFFMILHGGNDGMTILSYINLVLAGLFIGVYVIHQKNLWLPMGIHFAWNFALGPIFGSAVSGNNLQSIFTIELIGNDFVTGGAFGFEASFITTLLLIISIAFIHFKYKDKPIED